MKLNREQKVMQLTQRIMEGGWSSIYAFIDKHVSESELAEDDEVDAVDIDEDVFDFDEEEINL